MRVSATLRTLFSPYELAIGGTIAIWLGMLGMIGLLLIGAGPLAVITLVLLAGGAAFLLEEYSRCPNCGKPPIRVYLLDRETGIGRFMFRRRFWPERVCSSCGNRLDDL
jgi:hypothetical protein